jgi:hypothetical protein
MLKSLIAATISSVYLIANSQAATLENEYIKLVYSEKNGQILSISSPLWKGKTINPESNFNIYLHPEGEKKGNWLTFRTFRLTQKLIATESSLQCNYESKTASGVVKVITELRLKDQSVLLEVTVENKSKEPILEVQYPCLKNLSFAKNGKENELLWPSQTTMLIKDPANKLQQENYPRAAMNFIDLSGNGAGLGIIGNDSLIYTHYSYSKSKKNNGINLAISNQNQIKSNKKASFTFQLFLHDGNWRKSADYYREWFFRHFPRPAYPEWAKYSNGYLAIGWGEAEYPPYDTDVRIHINETWRLGLNHLQYWGQTARHTCPGYPLPDPMRGGEEMIKEMYSQVNKAGLKTGGYFWSCGIGKYEVLSESFRGIKWTEFREDLRPPSWDWVVKHSKYKMSRTAPDKTMNSSSWKRAKVKTIAEAEAKRLNPQQLHTLVFNSEGFQNWLFFWIKRYVGNYHIQVPYLDVYGHRPKVTEYNPYLNMWGDGTEGKARFAFLRRINTSLKAKDPEIYPVIEGVVDCYNTQAGALISHFRKFMEGYRYTFPEFILYEGMANGQWYPEKSKVALADAYMDGLRFDMWWKWITSNLDRIVWLRDSTVKIVADAKYLGKQGFKLSSSKIDASAFDAVDSWGVRLINIKNTENEKDATIKLEESLLDGAKAAYILATDGNFQKLSSFDKDIKISPAPVSSILLVTANVPESKSILPFVFPVMKADGLSFKIITLNLKNREKDVKANVMFMEKQEDIEIFEEQVPGFGIIEKNISFANQNIENKAERLTISFKWSEDCSWLAQIFCLNDNYSFDLRRIFEPNFEDPGFEWNKSMTLSEKVFRRGNSSLAVSPASAMQPFLRVAPNAETEISVYMNSKDAKPGHVLVYNHAQKKTYARLITQGKAKDDWIKLSAKFKTSDEGKLQISFVNPNKEKKIYFDDVQVKQRK